MLNESTTPDTPKPMQPSELFVTTRNLVNKETMEMQQVFLDLLAPRMGCKVRKISGHGGWIKEIDLALKAIYAEHRKSWKQFYLSCEYGSISFELDRSYPVGDCGCHYVKQYCGVGRTDDNGVLTDLCSPLDLRTDYSLEWVESQFALIRKLEDELYSVKHSVSDFI